MDAFSKPEIYQKIIFEYQGKAIPFEGLEIYLIRTHHFSDSGAKQCATVFLENAKFLGLINDDGIFNADGEITITAPQEKPKRVKSESTVRKTPPETKKPPIKDHASTSHIPAGNEPIGKSITVFIKGKRFLWNVPNSMNQLDWDDIEVQIRQLKEIAK